MSSMFGSILCNYASLFIGFIELLVLYIYTVPLFGIFLHQTNTWLSIIYWNDKNCTRKKFGCRS